MLQQVCEYLESLKPLERAKTLVLTPNNRCVLFLKNLLKERDGFLPSIYALSDVKDHPLMHHYPLDLAVPLSSFQRIDKLMELLPKSLSRAQAFGHSKELVEVLDNIALFRSDLKRLKSSPILLDCDVAYAPSNDEREAPFTVIASEAWQSRFSFPLSLNEGGILAMATPLLNSNEEKITLHFLELLKTQWDKENPVLWVGTPELTPLFDDVIKTIGSLPRGKVFLKEPIQKPLTPPTPISCSNLWQEARTIAALMYQHYQQNEPVSLISSNPKLNVFVQESLKAYGLVANDSLGTPLNQTPIGSFYRLLGQYLSNPTLVYWVAIQKHPLCGHPNRFEHLKKLRSQKLSKETMPPAFTKDTIKSLQEWTFDHQQKAKNLCGDSNLLRSEQDGKGMEDFFKELPNTPSLSSKDYTFLFEQYLTLASTVRMVEGIRSPLSILGPIEGRLTPDPVVILADMNEEKPTENSWLSPLLRKTLGLPSLEVLKKFKEQDFLYHLNASKVYMTRSVMVEGMMTEPSRLWMRLKGEEDCSMNLKTSLRGACDEAIQENWIATPPSGARNDVHNLPKTLSPTAIEWLARDPYGFYARYILKLKELPLLSQEIGGKEKGQLFHDILARLVQTPTYDWKEAFKELPPLEQHFWTKRFASIWQWIQTQTKGEVIHGEWTGKITINDLSIDIEARLDRLDCFNDGSIRVVDYKTGAPPTKQDMLDIYAPQLTIQGAIASSEAGTVRNLEIWHLTGLDPAVTMKSYPIDQLEFSMEKIVNLLKYYYTDPTAVFAPCPNPTKAPTFNEYKFLEMLMYT